MLNVVFPEQQELMAKMLEAGPMTYFLGIFYLLITGLTVMNMLIGVLVEARFDSRLVPGCRKVVSVTAQVDKEETAMKVRCFHGKLQLWEAVKEKIEEMSWSAF